MENQKKCFIITPIGRSDSITRRKIDGLLDEVLEPLLKELGYEVIVSHRINDSGTMTSAIIQNVYHCDLVIANLTGNNPNVMYELAIRHASGKPVIHITENISEIPFDINDQRTIEYKDDMSGAHELKEKLNLIIEGIKFDELARNPVTDALEKKDLVNVPKKKEVELGAVLENIQNDIRMIKREMSNVKYDITSKKAQSITTDRLLNYYLKLNDSDLLGNNTEEFSLSSKPYIKDYLTLENNKINTDYIIGEKKYKY